MKILGGIKINRGTTYFLSFLFSISRRFRWLMIKLTLYLRFKFTLSDNGH